MALVRDLRVRCPWDAKQTPESLRPYLVEETHELDAAIASGDVTAKRDELGDVLLNVAYQMVIAEERAEFSAHDVADVLIRKMERRHPHLFDLGPAEPWETIKRRERGDDGSMLGGIPASLPGLLKAHRMQARAATVGFDWPDTQGPAAKVREELAEVEAALRDSEPAEALASEVGDLLFAVVNLARKAGVDASAALDTANAKFERRFRAVEQIAGERGLVMTDTPLDTLDGIWDDVKREETRAQG
jgi:MazG family protein